MCRALVIIHQESKLDEFVKLLIFSGSISFGKFRLTSGIESPVYVDMRRALSHLKLRNLTVELLVNACKNITHEVIVGVATGGLAWAAIVADREGVPLAYFRGSRKGHGMSREVEGLVRGAKCLILDDVSTTGGNLASAVNAVRANDGEVEDAIVIVDRGQGASSRLKSLDVRLHSIINLRELVRRGRDIGLIDEDVFSEVLNYLEVYRVG